MNKVFLLNVFSISKITFLAVTLHQEIKTTNK